MKIPPPEAQGSSAEVHVPPPERSQFRALLLANPNHFGTSLDPAALPPVKVLSGNTTYEELGCVGYHPDLNLLKAVIKVKLSAGYGGALCSQGSREYVRFYLSFDNGASWEDDGVVSVSVHDLPGVKPLDYAVTVRPQSHATRCSRELLPRVRAILSWNAVPPANTPGFVPVWGNVVEAHIQIHPQKIYFVGDLLAEVKASFPVALDAAAALPVAAAMPPTAAELALAYPECVMSLRAFRLGGTVSRHWLFFDQIAS